MSGTPKRANQSMIWDHMTKVAGDKVNCNLCRKELIYSKSGSTSAMMYHLRSVHPSVFDDCKSPKQRQSPLSSFGIGPQRPCNESRQEQITALVVKFIVGNMLPISLVDSSTFRELMTFLEPNYNVPHRNTITKRMDSQKAELSRQVVEEMEGASAVHMTTDLWTSLANDAYISVTASYIVGDDWELKARTLANVEMEERHTQANISTRLADIASTWQIEQKTKVVVHDGASNMKEIGSTNKWSDISCSAHKLHLAVTGIAHF